MTRFVGLTLLTNHRFLSNEMKSFAAFALGVVLSSSGCVTFHGVKSYQENFGVVKNPACLDEAIKTTAGAEFIRSSDGDSKLNFFDSRGRKLHLLGHATYYRIANIEGPFEAEAEFDGSYPVDTPSNQKWEYRNTFGSYKDRRFSSREMAQIHNTIVGVNASVRDRCKLAGFNPDTNVNPSSLELLPH